MPTFNRISIEESATVTARVATVQFARGTTNEQQEILIIGDPDTSNALAAVTSTTPASTSWGLVVRPYGNSTVVIQGDSTVAPLAGSTWPTRPIQTSQADLRITAYQSTAADFNVTITGASTVAPLAGSTWNVRPLQSSQGDLRVTVYQSTAADLNVTVTGASTVAPLAGSTWATRPIQSSQADLRVTIYQSTATDLVANVSSLSGAVQARVYDSSGVAIVGSTNLPSSGVNALSIRQAQYPRIASFGASTVGNSSATEVVSSAAVRVYVYAYSMMTTLAGPLIGGFYTSNAALLWPIVLATPSSAISGANLAVSPPNYLFAGAVNEALTFRFPSASNAGISLGVSYFTGA